MGAAEPAHMNDDNNVDQLEVALLLLQLVTGGQQASAETASLKDSRPRPFSFDELGAQPKDRGKKGW